MLFAENTDLETGLAYTCTHRLCCFMDLLERCGRFLSKAEASQLYEHGSKFADEYMRLAHLCIKKKNSEITTRQSACDGEASAGRTFDLPIQHAASSLLH